MSTITTMFDLDQVLNYSVDGGKAKCKVLAIRIRTSDQPIAIIYEVLAKWREYDDKGKERFAERHEFPSEETLLKLNPRKVGDAISS